MKERPIIFNDEMVRAIMDGRKTQTRRVIKPQPPECTENGTPYTGWQKTTLPCKDGFDITAFLDNPKYIGDCPYGKPGDRLWVRETVADIGPRLTYRADKDDGGRCQAVKWTPSIHMPRWASRITLEITGVRVERVQDMTVSDAIAEGYDGSDSDTVDPSISWFREKIWCGIYGPDSWAANPWVWVIEFRRVE